MDVTRRERNWQGICAQCGTPFEFDADARKLDCKTCEAHLATKDPRLKGYAWSYDRQGKQDLDGPILSLSTRYRPRGGGYHTAYFMPSEPPIWEGNETRPEIKPSAKATIVYRGIDLTSAEFEAETEEEVKAQIEKWAGDQLERIDQAVRTLFNRGGV